MVRGMLAVVATVVLFLCLAPAQGQEEMPSHGSAENGSHSANGPSESHEDFPIEDYSDAPSENFLVWFIGALGWRYSLLLPLSALMSFALTAILVIGGKGRTTGPALIFIVAIPF